jgi:hypothetical protein
MVCLPLFNHFVGVNEMANELSRRILMRVETELR